MVQKYEDVLKNRKETSTFFVVVDYFIIFARKFDSNGNVIHRADSGWKYGGYDDASHPNTARGRSDFGRRYAYFGHFIEAFQDRQTSNVPS